MSFVIYTLKVNIRFRNVANKYQKIQLHSAGCARTTSLPPKELFWLIKELDLSNVGNTFGRLTKEELKITAPTKEILLVPTSLKQFLFWSKRKVIS